MMASSMTSQCSLENSRIVIDDKLSLHANPHIRHCWPRVSLSSCVMISCINLVITTVLVARKRMTCIVVVFYFSKCSVISDTVCITKISSNGSIFGVTGPFVRGINWSLVNSPHIGQRRGALMFSLIYALIKRWSKQSWGWWFETP